MASQPPILEKQREKTNTDSKCYGRIKGLFVALIVFLK